MRFLRTNLCRWCSVRACTVLASHNKTCVSARLATRDNLRTRCGYICETGNPIASLALAMIPGAISLRGSQIASDTSPLGAHITRNIGLQGAHIMGGGLYRSYNGTVCLHGLLATCMMRSSDLIWWLFLCSKSCLPWISVATVFQGVIFTWILWLRDERDCTIDSRVAKSRNAHTIYLRAQPFECQHPIHKRRKKVDFWHICGTFV